MAQLGTCPYLEKVRDVQYNIVNLLDFFEALLPQYPQEYKQNPNAICCPGHNVSPG